jgi:hypothetical protein
VGHGLMDGEKVFYSIVEQDTCHKKIARQVLHHKMVLEEKT